MNSLIGTREAAKLLNVSIRRVQALIASGHLPAEKIGNSYAIRQSDLGLLNGRKNGRPKPARARTQEEWNKILDKIIGSANDESPVSAKGGKFKKISISKRILAKPPHQRTADDWNSILDKLLGTVALGPRDLSTNKKYMEGYGRENAYRR